MKMACCIPLLAVMTVCVSMAPQYSAAPQNVMRLREGGLEPVTVGDFTVAPGHVKESESLSIRGSRYLSPYENSFAKYLQEALRAELAEARLLNPRSAIELTGVLVRNELNAALLK
jgi:hypothetical protein